MDSGITEESPQFWTKANLERAGHVLQIGMTCCHFIFLPQFLNQFSHKFINGFSKSTHNGLFKSFAFYKQFWKKMGMEGFS